MLIPPSSLDDVLSNVKRAMSSHFHLNLSTDPDAEIHTYYELLQNICIVLDEYLVEVLQIPLVDKSIILFAYKACNISIIYLPYERLSNKPWKGSI